MASKKLDPQQEHLLRAMLGALQEQLVPLEWKQKWKVTDLQALGEMLSSEKFCQASVDEILASIREKTKVYRMPGAVLQKLDARPEWEEACAFKHVKKQMTAAKVCVEKAKQAWEAYEESLCQQKLSLPLVITISTAHAIASQKALKPLTRLLHTPTGLHMLRTAAVRAAAGEPADASEVRAVPAGQQEVSYKGPCPACKALVVWSPFCSRCGFQRGCRKCGAEIEKEGRFCSQCGTPVASPQVEGHAG